MTDLDPQAVFRRRDDVRYRVIGGQAVVIVQEAAEAIVLNEVGTAVLELLEQGTSVEKTLEDLLQRFEVERETLERDVSEYLAKLIGAGVLEPLPH